MCVNQYTNFQLSVSSRLVQGELYPCIQRTASTKDKFKSFFDYNILGGRYSAC